MPAFDDVEAEELFLRFGEGTVDHDVLTSFAQRGGGGRGHEPRDRTEPSLVREFLAYRGEAAEHRIVLLLRPAAHDVFRVIAEDGVKHGVTSVAEAVHARAARA